METTEALFKGVRYYCRVIGEIHGAMLACLFDAGEVVLRREGQTFVLGQDYARSRNNIGALVGTYRCGS